MAAARHFALAPRADPPGDVASVGWAMETAASKLIAKKCDRIDYRLLASSNEDRSAKGDQSSVAASVASCRLWRRRVAMTAVLS